MQLTPAAATRPQHRQHEAFRPVSAQPPVFHGAMPALPRQPPARLSLPEPRGTEIFHGLLNRNRGPLSRDPPPQICLCRVRLTRGDVAPRALFGAGSGLFPSPRDSPPLQGLSPPPLFHRSPAPLGSRPALALGYATLVLSSPPPPQPPAPGIRLGKQEFFQSDSSTCLYFHSGVARRFQERLEFGSSTASHWVFQSSFLWSFLSKTVTAGWGFPCLTQTTSPLLSTGPQTVLCGFIL